MVKIIHEESVYLIPEDNNIVVLASDALPAKRRY